MHLLTLNAGSSSIKYKVFLHRPKQNEVLLSGLIEGIGECESHWHSQSSGQKETKAGRFHDHNEAFSALAHQLKQHLSEHSLQGVGHRVVHGGSSLYKPTIITPEVLAEIECLSPLAPLHNPINALGITYAKEHFKEALHVALFDSGFHHSMPPHARYYPINKISAEQYQLQRYGFHGINHEYVANQAAFFLKKPLSDCHFISLHLGNGASACLIKNGQSIDTSMGMTPLAGLMMGTRCGDVDPAIPLYLFRKGFSEKEIDTLLNKQSGLLGIAGDNDMRRVLEKAASNNTDAILAIDMYVYIIQKYLGAYLSQLPRLDALIFTGGVGENASLIREKIIATLSHLGFFMDSSLNANPNKSASCFPIHEKGVPMLIIPGDEEAFIAEQVARLIHETK